MLAHLKKGTSFALLNFGAPIAFFVVYQWAGAKPAIALAVGATVLQAVIHWIFSIRITPFFLVASGFTVGFGTIDLLIESPKFFRLEPFAQNFLIGSVFLISLKTRISVLGWLMGSLPESLRPGFDSSMSEYLRKLTLVWGLYLVAKAFVFLYLAFRVDLGHLVLFRSVIGGSTLAILVIGEIIYRRRYFAHHPRAPRHSGQSG